MCFDLLWNWGFLAIAIKPSLSPLIRVGSICFCPNSSYRLLNQQASRPASDRVIYSASVEESAIVVCFFYRHIIAPPADRKTYPDVDLRLSVLG